jgi:hypothetical protein
MTFARRHFLTIAATTVVVMLCGHRNAFADNQGKPQKMEEQQFWAIIQAAKTAAGTDVEARPSALGVQLSSLDLAAIQNFQRSYDDLILRANRWDLWGAAYVMNGGCSDDGFRYFRDWLISEGREVFERALSNPDSLSELQRREYFDLESFGYVALKTFSAKGGGELERDFSSELAMPSGKEWSEPELPALFPKLAAKYLER